MWLKNSCIKFQAISCINVCYENDIKAEKEEKVERKKSLRFINAWNWPETLYEKDVFGYRKHMKKRKEEKKWKWKWPAELKQFQSFMLSDSSLFLCQHIFTRFSLLPSFFALVSFVNVDQLIALWTINFRFMWTFNFSLSVFVSVSLFVFCDKKSTHKNDFIQ